MPCGQVQAFDRPRASKRPHHPPVEMNPPMPERLRDYRLAPATAKAIPLLHFEKAEKIAIQRHPQASVGAVGIEARCVDGLWTPKCESNPPRKSHYN